MDILYSDNVAALQRELKKCTEQQAARAAALKELEQQLADAGRRERNATSDCAAAVADITAALVAKEMSAASGESDYLDGTAALSDAYLDLQAEYTQLQEEEAHRTARLMTMERSLETSQQRVGQAAQRFDAMLAEIREVKGKLAAKEAHERAVIGGLEHRRAEARATIARHSEAHAQRLMEVWDSEAAAAASAVAREHEVALAAAHREGDRALEEDTAAARAAASAVAAHLAQRASAEYASAVAPAVARLEAQRARHASVAPRLLAVRSQCAQLLAGIRTGSDTGGDPRTLVEAFPLLASAADAATSSASGDGALASPRSSPGSGSGGPGKDASSPSPLMLRSPCDVYAAVEAQDAAAAGLTVGAARSGLCELMDRVVAQWRHGGGDGEGGLGLGGGAADDTWSDGAAAGAEGGGDLVQFLRDTQQAATGTSRPEMRQLPPLAAPPSTIGAPRDSDGGDALGDSSLAGGARDAARVTEVGAAYRREADRAASEAQIDATEHRLLHLTDQRRAAEDRAIAMRRRGASAYGNEVSGGSPPPASSAQVESAEVDAKRVALTLQPEIARLEEWLRQAVAAHRDRFGLAAGDRSSGAGLGGFGPPSAAAPARRPGQQQLALMGGFRASFEPPLFSPPAASPTASPESALTRSHWQRGDDAPRSLRRGGYDEYSPSSSPSVPPLRHPAAARPHSTRRGMTVDAMVRTGTC